MDFFRLMFPFHTWMGEGTQSYAVILKSYPKCETVRVGFLNFLNIFKISLLRAIYKTCPQVFKINNVLDKSNGQYMFIFLSTTSLINLAHTGQILVNQSDIEARLAVHIFILRLLTNST